MSTKSCIALLLTLSIFLQSTEAIVKFGDCPSPNPLAEFDATKFASGEPWLQNLGYFSPLGKGLCLSASFNPRPHNTSMEFVVKYQSQWGGTKYYSGHATADAEILGKVTVSYAGSSEETYYVLGVDPDYESYAVIWSCTSIGFMNNQNVVIMTKSRTPSYHAIDEAYAVLNKNGISTWPLQTMDQANC